MGRALLNLSSLPLSPHHLAVSFYKRRLRRQFSCSAVYCKTSKPRYKEVVPRAHGVLGASIGFGFAALGRNLGFTIS